MASVYIVQPKTEECRKWIKEHVPEDTLWFAGGLAVEHRYIEDLLIGLAEADFAGERDYDLIY